MKKNTFKNKALLIATAITTSMVMIGAPLDKAVAADKPVLVITNKAMSSQRSTTSPATSSPARTSRVSSVSNFDITPPQTVPRSDAIYNRPAVAPPITAQQIAGAAYFQGDNTIVGQRVKDINNQLVTLQTKTNRMAEQLRALQTKGRGNSAEYFANIATINTQLQTGTTPGNPRLVKRLATAQTNLDTLGKNISELNSLAVEIADTASKASFLLDSARSTYAVSGAVEEDHARLARLEDEVNNTIVIIERILNDVNDDITRTTAYLSTEQRNLRTLSLAVSNGNLYGKSLANYPFSRAQQSPLLQPASLSAQPAPMVQPMAQQAPMMEPPRGSFGPSSSVGAPKPLAKIRFDKPNVAFEQPIYVAVQNALEQYPDTRFELIAVHPTSGNPAQIAIESTRSRRNAERVLRTLTQMGVNLERIDLSYAPSNEAQSSEVHIFLR